MGSSALPDVQARFAIKATNPRSGTETVVLAQRYTPACGRPVSKPRIPARGLKLELDRAAPMRRANSVSKPRIPARGLKPASDVWAATVVLPAAYQSHESPLGD